LTEAGVAALPKGLDVARPPVPERIDGDVLFSQTCGYPLETIFRGQAVRLGTPCYDAEGCEGPTHCGFFVVPIDSRARTLRDLSGGTFLLNSRHSNSGMNLPRRALAEIADRGAFFGRVIETGSQPGNLDKIARGEADATAVDCVTYAFWRRHIGRNAAGDDRDPARRRAQAGPRSAVRGDPRRAPDQGHCRYAGGPLPRPPRL
jgi:hypothetical protein